jgi:MFS family permease
MWALFWDLLWSPLTTTNDTDTTTHHYLNHQKWRLMLSCGAILPMILIGLVVTVMPESPRWLLAKGRTDEARRVIAQLVVPHDTDHHDSAVQEMVQEIQSSIRREELARQQQVVEEDNNVTTTTTTNSIDWSCRRRIMTMMIGHSSVSPALRRMLLVGIGMAVAQQAVGIDAIQYYLLDVIGKGDWESETTESLILIGLGLLKLLFIMIGGGLLDRRGRRPMLFGSVMGMAVALFMIGIAFFIDSTWSKRTVVLFGLAVYLSSFSIGMGPGAWLIPAEVFPLGIRAKAMSWATFGNRITATLMSSTFLSTAALVGWSGFFFLLCIICLVILMFMYYYLPETKDKTLEEMTVYFAQWTGDTTLLEAEARVHHHPYHYTNNNGNSSSSSTTVEMVGSAVVNGGGGPSSSSSRQHHHVPAAMAAPTEREIT